MPNAVSGVCKRDGWESDGEPVTETEVIEEDEE